MRSSTAEPSAQFASFEACVELAAAIQRRLQRRQPRRLHLGQAFLSPLPPVGREPQSFRRALDRLGQIGQVGPQPAGRMARPREDGETIGCLLQKLATTRPSLLEATRTRRLPGNCGLLRLMTLYRRSRTSL